MPIVSALAALTRAAYLDDPPADEQREAYKALAHDARMRVDALRDERNALRTALWEACELVRGVSVYACAFGAGDRTTMQPVADECRTRVHAAEARADELARLAGEL